MTKKMRRWPVLAPTEQECCGCTACASVCPVHAITMKQDQKGYWTPVVDREKCIQCMQCERACFYRSGVLPREAFLQESYAAWLKNRQKRVSSQSGGMSAALAEQVIAVGGTAYGAIIDDDFVVRHRGCSTLEACNRLRGSKYVQSDINTAFVDVKRDVEAGKKVLFVGTPCQVAGLRKFMQHPCDNLLLVDLICFGVPSSTIWRDFLDSMQRRHPDERLEQVWFRDPQFGWHGSKANFKFDGKWYPNEEYNDLFYEGIAFRQNCYACKFDNLERPGDLTIGDCWFIENIDKNLADEAGISLVLVNNAHGKQWWDALDNVQKRQVDISKLMQPCLCHPALRPDATDAFWRDYPEHDIDWMIKQYVYHGQGKLEVKFRQEVSQIFGRVHGILGACKRWLISKQKDKNCK